MVASETTHARHAALLLHGLPSAVREQVVAKLNVDEATRLKPLLDELVRLGISPSMGQELQALAPSQLDARTPSTPPQSTVRELTAQERVDQLNADDVARCLQACSPVTVAQLLRAGAWRWKAQVLGLMPERRRARVLDYMHRVSPALAPAVLTSLCEHLCAQVAQVNAHRAQAAEPSPTASPSVEWPRVARPNVQGRFRRFIGWTR